MKIGKTELGSALFGVRARIDVERGLAEYRAGRPLKVTAGQDALLALPVEGLTADRLSEFRTLCIAPGPKLILTARRARALGFEGQSAIALTLSRHITPAQIISIVADAKADRITEAEPAGAAASAAVEMAKLAHGFPAVLAGTMGLEAAALNGSIACVEADAITRFRQDILLSLTMAGEARVPLASGIPTRFVVFRDATGSNSVAVVIGEPDRTRPVPVRLHSSCLTGDVFGSRRCDCGDQLQLARTRLANAGGGIILYLDQEGRGLGLANKMRAYGLQDAGLDTIDANTTLGFDDDERDYGIAARMLEMMNISRIMLLTNNPSKVEGLTKAGIEVVGRLPLQAPVNADNRRYLTAKAARAGHQLDHLIASLSGEGSPFREGGEARKASPEPLRLDQALTPEASPARSA